MKTRNYKKYEPEATEKCRGLRILSEPTATKKVESKNLKEVTATTLKNNLQQEKITLSNRSHAAKTNAVTKPT